MSLIALASIKGAPGVTATALGLALTWPTDDSVTLAELDSFGGDLSTWLGLSDQPGLVSLAAAIRRDQSVDVVSEHLQVINDDLKLLVGPMASETARVGVDRVASVVGNYAMSGTVLADLGRLPDTSSSISELWQQADLSVVVLRPILGEIQHLTASLERLQAANNLQVLLVGRGHYDAKEISDTLGVQVVGHVAHDESAVATITAGRADVKQLQRTKYLRSVGVVASALHGQLELEQQRSAEQVSA